MKVSSFALAAAALVSTVRAQYYQRSVACPTLGCVYPPHLTKFIPGQAFDIRVEVQAPLNGSEAYNNGQPGQDFELTISNSKKSGSVASFFGISEPSVDKYNFTYYEDLFAQANNSATFVNVLSKSYRHVALYEPGEYTATLKYNGGMQTVANWTVLDLGNKRKAKNVILFIGDGMTISMISAARLLGHKSINGQYLSKLKLDEAEAFGTQMPHSIDSFITDSANSATALYAGHKATVNGLNVYTDSTGKPYGDPKFETVFEMFRRIYKGAVGIVTTAFVADATPAAVCTHTSQRSQYDAIIEQFLVGVTGNYSWTKWDGPDVLFGGGGENFLPNTANKNISQFDRWAKAGYQLAYNKTQLEALDNSKRALGIMTQSNLPVWLDRNVNTGFLNKTKRALGDGPQLDQAGLREMTLKALDILEARSKQNKDKNGDCSGFMLMSEAASIDKQMHVLDYERALGDLLELDNTVAATLKKLEDMGIADETLVIVTADHGHGFDVFGSADTKYLQAQTDDRKKRDAIGVYRNSGLSEYQVAPGSLPNNQSVVYGSQGEGFPVQWDPRYAIAAGFGANPDHRESYNLSLPAPRVPAVGNATNSYANPADAPNGFLVNGTLPVNEPQGVHSLSDVAVFAWGPGSEEFARPAMNNIEIAFKMAKTLNLGRNQNVTSY